jgi:serine/threonine protein kinase
LTPNLQGEKNSPNHKTLQSDSSTRSSYKNCVKLIDFGHAVRFQSDEKQNRMTGSLFYLSPEIVNKKPYDYRIDIWALGILYYEMLYTLPPFYAEDDNEVFDLISLGEYSFPDLPYVSSKTKNNISQFLKKENTRISLHNILDL